MKLDSGRRPFGARFAAVALLALGLGALLGGCTTAQRPMRAAGAQTKDAQYQPAAPTIHLPEANAATFIGPDGRTWYLRWRHNHGKGECVEAYTPEPANVEKWSEMLTLGLKISGYSMEGERRMYEKLKSYDKGIVYSSRPLGKLGFIFRITMPEHHSTTVSRVIPVGQSAFMIGLEDRRTQPTGLMIDDWEALLASPKLRVPDTFYPKITR